MHKRLPFFSYPFKAHAITHHGTFRYDVTYHLQRDEDRHTVPMAWWNAPAMWLLHVPLALGVQSLAGRPVMWGLLGSIVVYYGLYEYIHWCMHVPAKRNIERSGIFFRLNGHHLLHHRYMKKNLNVVMPLADLVLGTLITRSPLKFAQPTGRSVPDVQPRLDVQKA
jgi:hypothetical protein